MSERYVKGTVPMVMEEFGKEKGGRIVASMHKHLEKLIAENPDDPKSFQKHSYGQIYPLIAFKRAFIEEGFTEEETYDWLYDHMMKMCDGLTKPLRKLMKLGLWRKVPGLFNTMLPKMYTEDSGFRWDTLVASRDESRFNMTSCPYYEKFKEYGCPELCKICCASDDRTYGFLSDKLVWQRTKTLARGGDCCDFDIWIKGRK